MPDMDDEHTPVYRAPVTARPLLPSGVHLPGRELQHGRHAEAKRRLFESRQHVIYQDRVNALRFRGIEGRIEYGLGNLLSAGIAFAEVKDGFDQAGLPFARALIRLELAMVLLSQDRFEESEREVVAAGEIFAAFEIYREFTGSVVILEELFRRRMGLLRRLSGSAPCGRWRVAPGFNPGVRLADFVFAPLPSGA